MPGQTICLLMSNRPEYIAIWLGLTQIGGVVALLNVNLSGVALAHCVDAAAPRHVIVEAELAERYEGAAPHLASVPDVWVHGTSAVTAPRIDLSIVNCSAAELSPHERPSVTLSDRALLIYTSGTTGLPKAAYVSHHRIMTWSFWFSALADMRRDDRMYNCLPLYHSVGGVVAVGAPLVNGGSVAIADRFSTRQFWDDVARWECTLFQYIGELCRYLVASTPGAKSHRLRLACGNGMSADVWTAFQKRFAIPRVLEFYAATEANFSLVNVEGKVGSIGRVPSFLAARNPIALVRFDVARGEPERGADGFCLRVLRGEIGEAIGRIEARGSARFEGYTSAADTEKKILRNVFKAGDAWLRSGDLMRVDEAGFYYFVDRVGDTFRWKGENVSTLEVASALCACPGVVDATVYGVAVSNADGRAGMALIAVTEAFDLAALSQHIKLMLPDYARPVFLRLRSSLDLTGTFKHQKQTLMREAFNPRLIADPLYVFDRATGGYVPLDDEGFSAIAKGAMRL
jgi:fatty-acyl-CoA synthase